MVRGQRRLVGGIAVAVIVLVLGRWTAEFATERLWEARVSEAAALVGTRFAIMTGALELVGLGAAIAWFCGNLLWVTRSVLLQTGEVPKSLIRLSERSLYLAAAGLGLILGVGVGGGTGTWLHSALLATADLRFGLADPLLQVDLGVFAGRLPFWELLYDRAAAMVLPALVVVAFLNTFGGTLRIIDRRLWLAPQSRPQLGLLLVAVAGLIGWRFALEPYRLAAARSASIAPSEFLLRTTVAELIVVFAATAATLTVVWAVRGRFVVALAGWVGLGLAVLGGSIIVESRVTETPLGPAELSPLREVDSVAFEIPQATGAAHLTDSLGPSIWDADALVRLASGDSNRVLDVTPGMVAINGSPARVWFVLRTRLLGDPSLVAVADHQSGPAGGLTSLRWGDDAFAPGIVPYVTLSRHHASPGAPVFDLDPAAAGVALSSTGRRIALAWALQHGPALRATANQRLAWRLDPVTRLGGIAPFAEWGRPHPTVVDRDVYWVSDGYLAVERFPSSRTVAWRGRDVGSVRAGFVGVVRARGGETRVFLRPDADSLATAWARIAAPLIEPASALLPTIAAELGVPGELVDIQAQVLQGSGWLGRSIAALGRQPRPANEFSHAGISIDPHRIPFADDRGGRVTSLLIAPLGPERIGLVTVPDSTTSLPTPRDLQQRWDRFPFFQQLRDSIRAAGAEYLPGAIRFSTIGDTLLAYQPNYALGLPGQGALVLVNMALGGRLGAGRTYQEAWQNLRGVAAPAAVGSASGPRLEQAREWLDRADAALKRGDLQEFGRAFGYLRALLRPAGDPAQEPKP